STFCGSLGTSSFLGGSSFFLGTAIGPMSPWGPPASPVALGCWPACGVGVGVAWPWAKRCVSPADMNPRVRTAAVTAHNELQGNTLENENDWAARIKRISACLFRWFYSSIDARTHLSRSHFLNSGRGSWRVVGYKLAPRQCGMNKAVSLFALFVVLSVGLIPAHAGDSPAQPKSATSPQIMTSDQVRPGMKGVAYTVFQGTQPETMGVEVLGVLKNLIGPKSDLILVRLTGEKAEYTGVVAGMSGSPVYID